MIFPPSGSCFTFFLENNNKRSSERLLYIFFEYMRIIQGSVCTQMNFDRMVGGENNLRNVLIVLILNIMNIVHVESCKVECFKVNYTSTLKMGAEYCSETLSTYNTIRCHMPRH
jgi:hypothetical protein